MKKVLRVAGQGVIVAAITLALDFTVMNVMFPALKRALSAPGEGNNRAYLPALYDHDLAPNENTTRVWGHVVYPWRTDRFAFRTGECAPREPEKDQENIFVIGDSFTEALGSSYERSFAGLMACDAARQGKALWNLGVASYSPAIYHRKIQAAAQRLGIKPAEISSSICRTSMTTPMSIVSKATASSGPAPPSSRSTPTGRRRRRRSISAHSSWRIS
jgi:hypothetical protein